MCMYVRACMLAHVRVRVRVCLCARTVCACTCVYERMHAFLPHTRCSGVHDAVLEQALLKQA